MALWDSFTENFELGLAGVADAGEHLVGIQSSHAAAVYAQQTAVDQGLTADAQAQLAAAAAKTEAKPGFLATAWHNTLNDLSGGALSLLSVLKYALYVAVAIAVAVGLFLYLPRRRTA